MEVADSPTSEAVAAGHAPAARREERPMVFFRRPDLSGQQLLFHRPRVGAPTTAQQQLATPTPAQLVTLDGQSQLGVPAVAQQSDGGLAVPEPAASSRSSRGDRPPRLLVSSNRLKDGPSQHRLRRLRLAVVLAALLDLLVTIVLLLPNGQDAWYHVDSFTSAVGPANIQRVSSVRVPLLVIAAVSNGLAIVAVYTTNDLLMTLYIIGLVVSDIWSMVLLLPHAFFFLRFLMDMILVWLVAEVRGNVENAWFITSFHRLRQ